MPPLDHPVILPRKLHVVCYSAVVSLVLTLGCSRAQAADESKSTSGKTLGFVMTTFSRATYLGKDDCPDGFVEREVEGFMASLTKAERNRLNRPENAKE